MANGSESGGVVTPTVRSGMKREFAMLMKAQAECGISTGQGRVTRSQNVALNNEQRRVTRSRNVALNNGLSSSPRSNDRVKSSEAKRRKKEVKSEKLVMERGSKETEEELPVSEEEDPKSDVVDAEEEGKDSDVVDAEEDGKDSDVVEGKGNVAKMGNEEGTLIDIMENKVIEVEIESVTAKNEVEVENGVMKHLVELESGPAKDEEIGSHAAKSEEIETDAVKNDTETETTVVKEIGNDDAKVINNCETVNEEVKDDIVEPMQEELAVGAEKQEVELKAAIEGATAGETVVMTAEGIGDNGVLQKPFRRFTRSALKQKEEAAEVSGTGDIKVVEPVESDAVSPMVTPAKMEMKMSKKVELNRVTANLKELLENGLLEGLPVRYIHASKVKGQPETGLSGIIKGSGILCYCNKCNGNEVVLPNQFVFHAGGGNKRPPDNIYLENGKTLRDVLNVCKNAPLDSLQLAIQNAIRCSSAEISIFCLNCKGPIPEAGTGRKMLLCDSCVVPKESQHSPPLLTDNSNRSSVSASDTKSSEQIGSSISRSKSRGRLTRKDIRMHKLVFEEDVLPDGTALAYYLLGEKLLEGYKKGSGIFCYCCDNEVSPSQFEAHAGCASRRKPYHNIYTSNGVSLHELAVKLSKERKLSPEENDDLCSICADGGDLLCCDNCPRAFHTVCVSLPSIPQGTWYCRYCENMFQKEKFVEHNANAVAAGRVAGVDPLEQITRRCIRIVETLDADICSCVLCRARDFSKTGFGPRTVIICDQCEKEYHVGCLQEHNMDNLKELPKGRWFCCVECNRVHSALEKLVADGEMMLPEVLLDRIKRKHAGKGSDNSPDLDIKWRLLRGRLVNEETRRFLSGAVTLLHEQFDPIADTTTSRLDLIPQMVYGRNFKDQDLGGMYTAILSVNSSVVSVGTIRIFGERFAELPLVATSSNHQGQGYFQCLFSCIENLLGSLHVRDLVLPAAAEAEAIWLNKFGFEKITQEQLREYRRDYQMMIFQGTSVLRKSVQKSSLEPKV